MTTLYLDHNSPARIVSSAHAYRALQSVANMSTAHNTCVGFTGRRQSDRTRGAPEQRLAEIVFELSHGPADGAVGHENLIRSLRKAAQTGRRFEGAKCIKRRQSGDHHTISDL